MKMKFKDELTYQERDMEKEKLLDNDNLDSYKINESSLKLNSTESKFF
jgi:hypothetical protein